MICFVEQSISKYFEQLNATLENTIVFEIIRLPVLFGSSEHIYISTYIPPMGSQFYDHKGISDGIVLLKRAILDLLVRHEDCSVILCDDLNARTGVKNTYFGIDNMDVTTVILDESRQNFYLPLDREIESTTPPLPCCWYQAVGKLGRLEIWCVDHEFEHENTVAYNLHILCIDTGSNTKSTKNLKRKIFPKLWPKH